MCFYIIILKYSYIIQPQTCPGGLAIHNMGALAKYVLSTVTWITYWSAYSCYTLERCYSHTVHTHTHTHTHGKILGWWFAWDSIRVLEDSTYTESGLGCDRFEWKSEGIVTHQYPAFFCSLQWCDHRKHKLIDIISVHACVYVCGRGGHS